MSKIAQAIQTVNTGIFSPTRRKVRLFAADRFDRTPSDYSTKYRLSVTCHSEAVLVDSSGDHFTAGIRTAKMAIVRELFGEFYSPIQDIRMALLNDDAEEAARLLDELQESMFSLESK